MKPTIRDNEAAIIYVQLRRAPRNQKQRCHRVIRQNPEDVNRVGRILFLPKSVPSP
jgi:hypothetical protein